MPAPFVENAVLFPLDGFSSLVKDQVTIDVCVRVHVWVFNFIPLFYLSVTIPVPCSFFFFFNHNCSVVQLEVGVGDSTRGSFVVENSFCYPKIFVISDEFANCLFELGEELSWNFNEDCIESVDCFWQDSHFYYIIPANP